MMLRVALCVLFMRSSEVGAAWKDVQPPLRLFCLVAIAGATCWLTVWLTVPSLADRESVPWRSVGSSIVLAAGLLAAIGYVSRRDLKDLVSEAQGAKKKD